MEWKKERESEKNSTPNIHPCNTSPKKHDYILPQRPVFFLTLHLGETLNLGQLKQGAQGAPGTGLAWGAWAGLN